MNKIALPLLLMFPLAACGSDTTPPNPHPSQGNDPPATTANLSSNDNSNDADSNQRHLTNAQREKYAVDGAQIGTSYADIRQIWTKAHPRYKVETKTAWADGGSRKFITTVRISTSLGDDALEARFSGPDSGNRAIFLSHTMQDMAVGKPIDRKAAEAVIATKFGNPALQDGPNTYGGEIVGNDGQLVDGCSQFQFPDRSDADDPGVNHPQCGFTALATIDADNESTANAVILQETDFALLAKLEKDDADGQQRAKEDAGKAGLKHAVKPRDL